MDKTARIGVDIGGTFTDFVFHDQRRGITRTGKRLTTPDNPSRAIVEGVLRLLDETGTAISQVGQIVHGTTLITNTVLERTGARIGLLTTRGFRDVLEMGREIRYDTNDLFMPPVPVLVPRQLRLEVGGRLLADGREREPLDENAVAEAFAWLVEEGRVEAVAIAFLHAWRNPEHEQRALRVARQRYPHLLISLSSQVAPEIREYERTVTTCVNAYVQPRVHGYLDRLQHDLRAIGYDGALQIMLSNGGVTTIKDAKDYPVRLIESGPAAGVMAAAFIARQTGDSRLLAFDVGGTTAKMSVIEDGEPLIQHQFEAARLQKFQAGSGLPLKVSVVDLIEIGSGGGSIAAVDSSGLMRVGPRSAGAVPGPVCYDRGGADPTVTDADLLLGALDAHGFLGGEMSLDLGKVREAMHAKLAVPLKIDVLAAARGIQAIVDENMAAATRMHLAEKGKDARDFTLFAFGGAGPVHAYALARLLGMRRVIVPVGAGVISALGFLVAAPTVDQVRGYVTGLGSADWTRVNALFDAMERDAREVLASTHGQNAEVEVSWLADMRYAGQGFELTVHLPRGPLGCSHVKEIEQLFLQAYRERFGRLVSGVEVEAVHWRLTARLPAQQFSLASAVGDGQADRGRREIHFPDHGPVSAVVYDRYALAPGVVMRGPAVVQERETSCAFGPECRFWVDAVGNLILELEPRTDGHARDVLASSAQEA
jgi:N-methylhydantoinase A